MSLNYPFRGNGNQLNCKRRAYSEEREESLCLILCLRVIKRKEEAL